MAFFDGHGVLSDLFGGSRLGTGLYLGIQALCAVLAVKRAPARYRLGAEVERLAEQCRGIPFLQVKRHHIQPALERVGPAAPDCAPFRGASLAGFLVLFSLEGTPFCKLILTLRSVTQF